MVASSSLKAINVSAASFNSERAAAAAGRTPAPSSSISLTNGIREDKPARLCSYSIRWICCRPTTCTTPGRVRSIVMIIVYFGIFISHFVLYCFYSRTSRRLLRLSIKLSLSLSSM